MGPEDSVGPLYVGPLRTEAQQPAASGDRRCEGGGSLETWQVAGKGNYLLGVWVTGFESLRHRKKETQGTKGSAEDPSAVQGESWLLPRDAEEIQLVRI